MFRKAILGILAVTLMASVAEATTIYPIDQATILAGSTFDLKVEFDGVVNPADVKVTVNGQGHTQILGRPAIFVEREKRVGALALILRDVSLDKPGTSTVEASDGKAARTVSREMYGTHGARKAKNVILFSGDGFSVAHRTAGSYKRA